jgi:hypothetical protein
MKIWEAVALVGELVTTRETAQIFMLWLNMYWKIRRQDPYLLPEDIIQIIRQDFHKHRHLIIQQHLE